MEDFLPGVVEESHPSDGGAGTWIGLLVLLLLLVAGGVVARVSEVAVGSCVGIDWTRAVLGELIITISDPASVSDKGKSPIGDTGDRIIPPLFGGE